MLIRLTRLGFSCCAQSLSYHCLSTKFMLCSHDSSSGFKRESYSGKVWVCPRCTTKNVGAFEAWGWRGNDPPVGTYRALWRDCGVLSESLYEIKTGWPLPSSAWPGRLLGQRHKCRRVPVLFRISPNSGQVCGQNWTKSLSSRQASSSSGQYLGF